MLLGSTMHHYQGDCTVFAALDDVHDTIFCPVRLKDSLNVTMALLQA